MSNASPFDPAVDHYGVIGNPVAHSKSPQIHTAFARQCGAKLLYTTLFAETDEFPASVETFFQRGGKGLNVTVPFKQQAWQLAQQLSQRAQLAGAANTLWRDADSQLCADNTDGVGLVRDLENNHGCQINRRRVLVLGAGGAVRGVLEPLLKAEPQAVVIANRTLSRAEQLVELFSPVGSLSACAYSELQGQHFDLIINGTAASLQGELPPLPAGLLAEAGWCYDMMYAAEATVFQQWARAQGAERSLDGLGMLVEQAAESFYIWRQSRPETATVISEIRRSLSAA